MLRPSLRLALPAGIALCGVFAGAAELPEREPLQLGVVSLYNPRSMFIKYQPLVDYLSQQTGRSWELSMSRRYEDAVADLCSGRTSVAYLGPLTYVRARVACGAEPLVRLNTGGRATYRSHILVRADSPFEELKDLRGQRIGFGEPLSTSSHLVPRALLLDAGLEVGTELSCVYYDHHERAARAVLLGEVEACGIRDLVGEGFLARGLRTLARSEPIPNFPIVAGPGTSPRLRETVLRALLAFTLHSPGQPGTHWDRELAAGFAPVTDAEYDPVRRLAARIFGPLALTLEPGQLRCKERVP